MRTDSEALRECPVCETPVADLDLGLRDFTWVNEFLPGRVGASDIDFVLEQNKTGRVLIMEYKPASERLPAGQRLMLQRMVRAEFDVWVVWTYKNGKRVRVGAMNRDGEVPFTQSLGIPGLARRVLDWWDSGFED